MNNLAYKLVKQFYIEPLNKKISGNIGVEIELPVVSLKENQNLKKLGHNFLSYMVKNNLFKIDILGSDDMIVRISNENRDCLSFDYSYSALEFSMNYNKSINKIADRFYNLLKISQEYYSKFDCLLSGMGTNLNYNCDVEFTNDPFYSVIRKFLKEYTQPKDPYLQFTNIFSVQTHIDINPQDMVNAINTFNKLDFARAILFSNSVNTNKYPAKHLNLTVDTICARDFAWDNCGLPNTGIFDNEFKNQDDIIKAIANEEIFLNIREGKLNYFEPISLNDYFNKSDSLDEDIKTFRSFKRCLFNSKNVLEIRGDCVQPIRESFASVAFNVGLYFSLDKVKILTDSFFVENKITYSNSELRRKVILGEDFIEKNILSDFLFKLIDLAKAGLEKRGLSEEIHLNALYSRAKTLISPAMDTLEKLNSGVSLEDILKERSVL